MTELAVLNKKRIVFIGGGNMAGALIDGLLCARAAQGLDFEIGVSDPNVPNRDAFIAKGVRACAPEDAGELVAAADVLVLAVKPQGMAAACADLRPFVTDALIISVAAGVSIAHLSELTGSARIVRTMPNLPATIGMGATGLFATLEKADKQLATAIMSASGVTQWVATEEDLHTVTAVAGSAPAYFFYMLETMIDKAVAMGLDYKAAHQLAVQTMHGAAIMAADDDPSVLRAKVTSKGGTTHAAISHLQAQHVATHLADAMQACADRSRQLGQ